MQTTRNDCSTQSKQPKARKQRKTSYRCKDKNTAASEALKRKWAEDPVWAAKMRATLQAHRHTGRLGSPDGMSRKEAEVLWVLAREHSRRFITIMEEADKLPLVTIPGSEEEMAKETLRHAYEMAVGPLTDAKTKSSYMRIVLDFTKAKPESKSKLTLDNSEEWLAALSKDLKNAGSGQ